MGIGRTPVRPGEPATLCFGRLGHALCVYANLIPSISARRDPLSPEATALSFRRHLTPLVLPVKRIKPPRCLLSRSPN